MIEVQARFGTVPHYQGKIGYQTTTIPKLMSGCTGDLGKTESCAASISR
jgi:hypothetical protein